MDAREGLVFAIVSEDKRLTVREVAYTLKLFISQCLSSSDNGFGYVLSISSMGSAPTPTWTKANCVAVCQEMKAHVRNEGNRFLHTILTED